jgi:anthranilate synthase component 1
VIEGIEAARAANAAGRPALLWRRQLADTETPVAAALKLIEPGRGDFLLESVEGGATRGRHSLIGLAPDLVFRATGNEAAINPQWLTDRNAFKPCAEPALAALRALVGANAAPSTCPRAAARARLPGRLFQL